MQYSFALLALAASVSAQAASQITDGQVQVPTAVAAVTQIADGQIQAAPSAAPVKQIADGQIQAVSAAPVAAPVSQIADGQIQAAPSPVKQISDGQIQAPVSTGTVAVPVNGTVATPSPQAFTGAASFVTFSSGLFAAAGVAAAFALL